MNRHLAGLLSVLLALPACAPVVRAPRVLPLADADRALADEASRAMAAALEHTLADDALVLLDGEPVLSGPVALTKLPADAKLEWRAAHSDVSRDGTRGFSYGLGRRRDRGDSVSPIKYLAFWRVSNGAWKVVGFVLLPTVATATVPPAVGPSAAPPATASVNREAESEAEARRADLDFAATSMREGAGRAFGKFAANDAVLVGGGTTSPAGAAAIEAVMSKSLAGYEVNWAPVAADAAPSGDLAMTIGTAKFVKGPTVFYSKYLTVWRRQADGNWKYILDAGNDTPAPK